MRIQLRWRTPQLELAQNWLDGTMGSQRQEAMRPNVVTVTPPLLSKCKQLHKQRIVCSHASGLQATCLWKGQGLTENVKSYMPIALPSVIWQEFQKRWPTYAERYSRRSDSSQPCVNTFNEMQGMHCFTSRGDKQCAVALLYKMHDPTNISNLKGAAYAPIM